MIITDAYTSGDNSSATFTFTDPAFAGISLVSNDYPATPTSSKVGGVMTIDFGAVAAANLTPGATYTVVFDVTTLPEPASFALMLVGVGWTAVNSTCACE